MSFEKENLSLRKKDTVTLTGHRSFVNYHFGHTKGKNFEFGRDLLFILFNKFSHMEFNKKCGKGKEFPPSHSKYFWPLRVIDCNSCERLISGNLCYDLTDHLLNFLIVSKLSSLPASTKVFRRDYSNLDRETLISDIQSIDWNSLLKKSSDPSNMFDNFYIKLSEVVDLHVPVKQLSKQDLKARSKPWITSGIRTSIRIKNGLFKKFLKTKSIYYHTKFKIYRNKLNHLIKLAKKNYYNNFFSVHENNGKRI